MLTHRPDADGWFRPVVEAAPNAMILIDRERRIVLVNRAAEVLFGYGREELVGQAVEILVPERVAAAHPALVDNFHASPRARAMGAGRDLHGRRKDGSEVPIEIGLNPLVTAAGHWTLASIIDITERRRAQERFRLVVEAAPNAMLMVDTQGHIALVNAKTEELFGHERQALIGQPIERLIPERFRGRHPNFVRGFLGHPQVRPMGAGRELFGLRRDGSEVPIEIGLNPIETGEGRFTLAAIIDISERKRAESAHERLAAIVESSDDAIVSMSPDGIITSWNHGAEQLFGYSSGEAVGASVLMLVPHQFLTLETEILPRAPGDLSTNHFETVRLRKDGSEVDVSVRRSPIRSSAGVVLGESSIIRDISESKRRSVELQRSNEELEQFAYVASHDLQEPLRMVANYTELLAQRYQGQLDERADKYIHYASDGARRMQRLVADLLAYSRVGSQGQPLVPTSSQQTLQDVLKGLRQVVRETGSRVEFDNLPMVMADPSQLHQLLQNLISNAIKFRGAAPPHIVVTAQRNGTTCSFAVADNGIGLERRFAERIFQMFQRLHELGRYEGSGIGLAICKRIVERHGGHIWVESTPGQGSTFHFTLASETKGKT